MRHDADHGVVTTPGMVMKDILLAGCCLLLYSLLYVACPCMVMGAGNIVFGCCIEPALS